MPAPAISIITPTLDASATLGRALASLAMQGVDFESIVVDGGSRDDTGGIARAQARTRLIVAPGSSIYEALNLGIGAATAPLIGFLNADDAYLEGALGRAITALERNPGAEIAHGLPEFVEASAGTEVTHDARNERRAASILTLDLILTGPVAINSMVFRRGLFQRIGTFDASLRIASDREWMLRTWRAGARIVEIRHPVYRYYIHPGSTTLDRQQRNYRAIRREHLIILRRALAEPIADRDMRRALHRWHAREVGMMTADLCRESQWGEAAAQAGRAFAVTPLWPLYLAGDALAWADRRRRG